MKKAKYFTLVLVILGGLFFLLGPEAIPGNFQLQEILSSAADNDVIIIFNSGGWGNTPLAEAEDFVPVIEGIQETLNNWGYTSIVIPYNRTKNTLLGKTAGARDFMNSFKSSSESLAEEIEFLAENLPNKKIIMTGLSAGGALVDGTMEKISQNTQVYAVTAGIPFWHNSSNLENTLQLNNNGKDSLAEGDAKSLALALIKAPFKWIFSKLNDQNLTFSQAILIPGHEYYWPSPEVGPQIVTFLEEKIR